jgi:hypothetical protein
MAYSPLDAGTGAAAPNFTVGDNWTPDHATDTRNNFADHETRILGHETRVAALEATPARLVRLAQIVTAGAQTTVDFTGIPAGYWKLVIEALVQDTQAGTGGVQLRLMVNGDATAANYTASGRIGSQNGSAFATGVAASVKGGALGSSTQSGNTSMAAQNIWTILGYAQTAFHKRIRCDIDYDELALNQTIYSCGVRWKSTAAINRVTIGTDGTAFANGLVFNLYAIL